MNWKENLEKIEQSSDWKSAIKVEAQNAKDRSSEIEISVRVIFLLLDILVEGHYTPEEHEYMAVKIKEYYERSYEKFSEDAEYLFFLGFIIPIAEWYFGITDVSRAYEMRRKSSEKEPNNILYKWSYSFSDSENKQAGYLAEQLLRNSSSEIDWLNSTGLIGKYIVGMIEYSYNNYKNSTIP